MNLISTSRLLLMGPFFLVVVLGLSVQTAASTTTPQSSSTQQSEDDSSSSREGEDIFLSKNNDDPQDLHPMNQNRDLFSPRIIGGSDAVKDEYPWFARATYNNHTRRFGCGGSLVTPEFVLTAAHCGYNSRIDIRFKGFQIGALCFPYGPSKKKNCGQKVERFGIDEVFDHPGYDKRTSNKDFSLVRLNGRSTINPVPMDTNETSSGYEGGESLWPSGFGDVTEGDGVIPKRLQHVMVPYVTNSVCSSIYANSDFTITPATMCAGDLSDGGEDTCIGDSGGPLYDKNKDKLVGISSWGHTRCGLLNYPGVYARISDQWESWIKPTICENHSYPKPEYCPETPSTFPSPSPSESPSVSALPSLTPSVLPSSLPSISAIPTGLPSVSPSTLPSISAIPTGLPSVSPSTLPSTSISAIPSGLPSISELPSASPTEYSSLKRCTTYGEPHFNTWGHLVYSHQDGCDVILVKNSCVEIHLRLKRTESGRKWSTSQSVGVKIGSDILETKADLETRSNWKYYINDPTLTTPYTSSNVVPVDADIGGWSLTVYGNDLRLLHPSGNGKILIRRLRSFKGLGFFVDIEGQHRDFDECFEDSVGLCSKFDKDDQSLYDRNGDEMAGGGRNKYFFGQEWQVVPSDEQILSSVTDDPIGGHFEYPLTCNGESHDRELTTEDLPESCQNNTLSDIATNRNAFVPNASAPDACVHCHTLWSIDLICSCDFDALFYGCDNIADIYNDENMEFLNPDPETDILHIRDFCNVHSDCFSQIFPDPHFTTWNGDRYDFHNECDMVHVTNDHLDLHIRTEALWNNGHYWSGVVQAALRFDNDVLEVNALEENKVSVNGVLVTSDSFTLDGMYPVTNTFGRLKKSLKSTEKVRVKMSGGQYIDFLFHLDTLVIRMDAHGSDFHDSKGMTGNWIKPGLIGRDGVTSYEIPAKKEHSHQSVLFAMEWEVDADRGDPILFSTPSTGKCADTPQAPPLESEDEDRRLVDMESAKKLCDRVVAESMPGREECIFDVLRSNFDEEVLENPAYKDPFTSIERCVSAPEEVVSANGDTNGLSCAELGGKCVYRCNAVKYDCRPDALCVEATDLTVVDAARRRMRKLEFIEGCSCALPKIMASSVVDVSSTSSDDDVDCMDDPDFLFAIGEGVRGTSMKKCEWLTEMEGRADEYCETKGSDPDATTMIKSACRGSCADYLSECF